jgi:hypothetical protein
MLGRYSVNSTESFGSKIMDDNLQTVRAGKDKRKRILTVVADR